MSDATDGRFGAADRATAAEPVVSALRDGIPSAERFYVDCEFDGHGGPLLSIALVHESGCSIHIQTDERPCDPWVAENVMPHMESHEAWTSSCDVPAAHAGPLLRDWLIDVEHPVFVADSPVDIGRICTVLSTGYDGGWASADYPRMSFEVHNVDCYPTELPNAVQHNAWWDAMALRHKLTAQAIEARSGETERLDPQDESAVLQDAPQTAQTPTGDQHD